MNSYKFNRDRLAESSFAKLNDKNQFLKNNSNQKKKEKEKNQQTWTQPYKYLTK